MKSRPKSGRERLHVQTNKFIWVIVKIIVPFWVLNGVDGSCCVGYNLSYKLLMLSRSEVGFG